MDSGKLIEALAAIRSSWPLGDDLLPTDRLWHIPGPSINLGRRNC